MVAVCLCLLDQSPPLGPPDASPQPRQGHATVPLVVRQWVGSSPPPLRAPLPGPLPDRAVQDETYLWVLTRYVHLNPVRASLAATPEAWIWSSCPGYFRRRDRLDWVAYDALLAAWAGEFGRTDPEASYRRFVAAGLTTPPAPPQLEIRCQFIILGGNPVRGNRDSSLISTSVRMVHTQRTSDEKRPGRGRQRINPREFATTGPRTPETAANYLLHRGLRQDGGGDQRGVSGNPASVHHSCPKR